MRHSSLSFLILVSGLALSCAGGEDDRSTTDKTPPLVIGGEDASAKAASLYQMPTPNELFRIIRELDGAGQKGALSAPMKADRFATLRARSLNFGVYATDMVYASNFKITSEVVRYYLACKDIGAQLGLTSSFSPEMQVRLEKNITHGDSLDVLTNDAYYSAYQKLQEEDMGPVLTLVLAGGWVESMHLVMSKVESYDANNAIVDRIAEQKVSLEQLCDMMEAQKDDENVAPIRLQLMAIRDIYDQLNVVRKAHDGASPSGRMILGDDVSVSLTPEKYNQLKSAVGKLREEITRPEDAASNNRS
jgi:hypothetical protein